MRGLACAGVAGHVRLFTNKHTVLAIILANAAESDDRKTSYGPPNNEKFKDKSASV